MVKISPNETAIDWALGTKLAGGKRSLAKKLISHLCKMLPHEIAALKKSVLENDQQGLLNQTHSLRGAAAYCGVPNLQSLLKQLDIAIKSNSPTITSVLTNIALEVDRILAASKEK